ncbi:MAG: 50S ribosomal protein L15, partial [Aquificota bacterium]
GPGSGHGKTSCRGQKGQRSRSGGGVAPWFEGGQTPIHRRLPKRGFKCPTRKEYAIVNLETLEIKFQAGDVVTPEGLREIGLVKRLGHGVKVLARGELTKPLTVKAHLFSRQAIEKIEAAGGKAEVLR